MHRAFVLKTKIWKNLKLVLTIILSNKNEIAKGRAQMIKFFEAETKALVESLPFKLTDDQRKAAWQILSDLQKGRPANRRHSGLRAGEKVVTSANFMIDSESRMKAALGN